MRVLKTVKKSIFKKFQRIPTRIRFAISTLALTFVTGVSTLYFMEEMPIFIPLLILSTYVMTYFALLEDIEKVEWFFLFVMPIAFTILSYSFYLLFPVRWLTRAPFLIFYAVSIYALLLSSNIFNVGVKKTLRLYRAAFSINFLYQTIVLFFFFNLLFSLRLSFLYNAVLTFIAVYILAIQVLWSVNPSLEVDAEVSHMSLLISVFLAEAVIVLSFININVSIFALFLVSFYYLLTGLSYAYLTQMFFKKNIQGYIISFAFVTVITLISLL